MITPVSTKEILDYFRPVQGAINFYYGHVGNGKTYAATSDIWDLLRRGEVVYANWKVQVPDFDQKESLIYTIYHLIFFRKRFFKFPSSNFHYFNSDDIDITFLSRLANCHIFIDEGQWIFDSYEGTKFSKEKRKLILHTRHYNRTLNVISQRTNAIQVSARGNVERFFKCEKVLSYPFLVFRRIEYQDMQGDNVDETKPASTKVYLARKEIMRSYNTLFMRGADAVVQEVNFEAWDSTFIDRFMLFWRALTKPWRAK